MNILQHFHQEKAFAPGDRKCSINAIFLRKYPAKFFFGWLPICRPHQNENTHDKHIVYDWIIS